MHIDTSFSITTHLSLDVTSYPAFLGGNRFHPNKSVVSRIHFLFSFLRKGGMIACGDIYRVAKQLQGIESLTRSNVLVKMLSSRLVNRGLPWKYFKSTCSGVLRSSSLSSFSNFQSRTYHSRTGVYGFVPPDNSSSAKSSGKSACDGYF
jgi:hypothetical protein